MIRLRQDRALGRRIGHLARQHVVLLDDFHHGGDGDAFVEGDGVLQGVAAGHHLDDLAHRGVSGDFVFAGLERLAAAMKAIGDAEQERVRDQSFALKRCCDLRPRCAPLDHERFGFGVGARA